MAKYKILKSIAHNTAHSYLGATNHFADGFPFEHLLRSCRSHQVLLVRIDMLHATIEPAQVKDRFVAESLDVLTFTFDRQLASAGWTRASLREATIGLDLSAGTCVSRIVDDRGVEHSASVVQWGAVNWDDWAPAFRTLAHDA